MFRCENGPCIPGSLHCNGVVDCPFDVSDELDCGLLRYRKCGRMRANSWARECNKNNADFNGFSCVVEILLCVHTNRKFL